MENAEVSVFCSNIYRLRMVKMKRVAEMYIIKDDKI